MILEKFKHQISHTLLYEGDCKLLGITQEGLIYAEELYGEDDWLAQHRLSVQDGILESVDEAYGNNPKMDLFKLPESLIRPQIVDPIHPLNFTGARLRGLRAEDHIDDLVLPLEMADKIDLVDYMEWDIEPVQLLGIAESIVLAQTPSPIDDVDIVCRRVRVAYTLPQRQLAQSGDYDYDVLSLFLVHEYTADNQEVAPIVECLDSIDEVLLLRPMDCLYYAAHLYIADGGEDEDLSAIHIFRLE